LLLVELLAFYGRQIRIKRVVFVINLRNFRGTVIGSLILLLLVFSSFLLSVYLRSNSVFWFYRGTFFLFFIFASIFISTDVLI